MKTRLTLLIACAALILAGCFVPSLHPLYTDKDLVFDPALVGTWGETNDADRQVFARDGDMAYRWTSIEKEATNVFRAHVLQLDGARFLDAILVRTTDEWKGVGRVSVVIRPAHIFFKLQLTNATLRLDALNYDWLDKLLKQNPQALAHERLHEPDMDEKEARLMLTAPTAELQRFVLKHAGDTNAFPTGDPLPRLEPAQAKSAVR